MIDYFSNYVKFYNLSQSIIFQLFIYWKIIVYKLVSSYISNIYISTIYLLENHSIQTCILKNYPAKIPKISYFNNYLTTIDTNQKNLLKIYPEKLKKNIQFENDYQKQVFNETLSYLINILNKKHLHVQFCFSIVMKNSFSIMMKISFSTMIKFCFSTIQFIKMDCLEKIISVLYFSYNTTLNLCCTYFITYQMHIQTMLKTFVNHILQVNFFQQLHKNLPHNI